MANVPPTDAQRGAVAQARAAYRDLIAMLPFGTAESVEQRARRPDPETLPADLTVRIEIAPPSAQPHPLLRDTGVLKTPERVPVYSYTLRGDRNDDGTDVDPANTRVLFFIHGGGNVTGHPTQPPFLQLYAKLLRGIAATSTAASSTTKWVLIAPSYRVATVPENVFPAGLQDVFAAYDYVLAQGYAASNVFIAGDSAGGNYAIVLTHLLQHAQPPRPAPRGVVAIAPSAISLNALDRPASAQAEEDIIDVPTYEAMGRAYIAGTGVSPAHPLVSGAFLTFTPTWPRTLLLVGTKDNLIDGSREVKRRLVASGCPVELVEYEQRPHGWWVMPQIFPENIQDAVERISRFVVN